MRAESFVMLCRLLWGDPRGDNWGVDGAADFLAVARRNVLYWGAGTKAIPPGVVRELHAEIRSRLADQDDRTPGLDVFRELPAPCEG